MQAWAHEAKRAGVWLGESVASARLSCKLWTGAGAMGGLRLSRAHCDGSAGEQRQGWSGDRCHNLGFLGDSCGSDDPKDISQGRGGRVGGGDAVVREENENVCEKIQ